MTMTTPIRRFNVGDTVLFKHQKTKMSAFHNYAKNLYVIESRSGWLGRSILEYDDVAPGHMIEADKRYELVYGFEIKKLQEESVS